MAIDAQDRRARPALRELSAGAARVLLAVLVRRGRSARVLASDDEIAAELGCTRGHVRRYWPELEAAGWLRWAGHEDGRRILVLTHGGEP